MISKARIASSVAFQQPGHLANDRDPRDIAPVDVCPHCKRATVVHGFTTPDGHWIGTHHCAEHGDVIPMRGHVVNP